MSYFMVRGCSTLFDTRDEANKKALEIANSKLSELLLTKEVLEYQALCYTDEGDQFGSTREIDSYTLKPIKSKQELLDIASEFDLIVSTHVVELFQEEELIID
jgi:hypothetical protein